MTGDLCRDGSLESYAQLDTILKQSALGNTVGVLVHSVDSQHWQVPYYRAGVPDSVDETGDDWLLGCMASRYASPVSVAIFLTLAADAARNLYFS